MHLPAPLAVAVEIRVGPDRVWRVSQHLGEEGVSLARVLPEEYERGRPVSVELRLPDDPVVVTAAGIVAGERLIRFTSLDAETRARVARYVEERMSAP